MAVRCNPLKSGKIRASLGLANLPRGIMSCASYIGAASGSGGRSSAQRHSRYSATSGRRRRTCTSPVRARSSLPSRLLRRCGNLPAETDVTYARRPAHSRRSRPRASLRERIPRPECWAPFLPARLGWLVPQFLVRLRLFLLSNSKVVDATVHGGDGWQRSIRTAESKLVEIDRQR